MKEQAERQKEEAKQKPQRIIGGLTFSTTLDSYAKAINKFEEFAKNYKITQEAIEGTEGGRTTPPSSFENPYTGPIDKNTFFPLPGGTLSNQANGVPRGEYGSDRNYGGHSGQDIGGLPPNSPVVAWKTGIVRVEPGLEGPDNIITIDHGGGVYSKYKHVVASVRNGELVYGGQKIATLLAGKEAVRGRLYDTHLHFEVWRNNRHVNPNRDLSASQKIPSFIEKSRAKENFEKSQQPQQPQPNVRQNTPPQRGFEGDKVSFVPKPNRGIEIYPSDSSVNSVIAISQPPQKSEKNIAMVPNNFGSLHTQGISVLNKDFTTALLAFT